MEHSVKLQCVKKSYKNDIGETLYYQVIQLLIDDYMEVKFDTTKDNYKNLLNMAKNGHTFKFE